jgi:hypothetical protein
MDKTAHARQHGNGEAPKRSPESEGLLTCVRDPRQPAAISGGKLFEAARHVGRRGALCPEGTKRAYVVHNFNPDPVDWRVGSWYISLGGPLRPFRLCRSQTCEIGPALIGFFLSLKASVSMSAVLSKA